MPPAPPEMPPHDSTDENAPSARQSGTPARAARPFADRRRRRREGLGARARGVHAFLTRDLWARELASLPTFRRWGYGIARVVQLTLTNFVKDRCTWRAAALTYITVLSLVPMLAFAFSVAKGMGAYQQLQQQTIIPFLDSTFGPASGGGPVVPPAAAGEGADAQDSATPEGPADGDVQDAPDAAEPLPATEDPSEDPTDASSPEVDPDAEGVDDVAEEVTHTIQEGGGGAEVRRAIDTVLAFVESTDVSKLGALGFLIVLYTVVKLLGSVELSFNDIWGVRKARSLPRKIADYFSTVVMVPLLLVTGTTVMNLARAGFFGRGESAAAADGGFVASLLSVAVVWLGFAFAYLLLPNTRTRVTSALVGGVVGGTMWQLFQWAHVTLQVGVANYNAIYSTFAALPIFLFWVHTSWMTVLLGAECAAAHQNQARHGQLVRSRDYDLAQKEALALRLVARVTRAFVAGDPPRSSEALAEELGCPERTLEEVAAALEGAGLMATVDAEEEDPILVLVADPGIVRIQDVLDGLKGASVEERGDDDEEADGSSLDARVRRAFGSFRTQRDEASGNLTLRELAGAGPEAD